MKRLFYLLLLGLFGVGAYLLGLLWPPDQVVASLFLGSGFGACITRFRSSLSWSLLARFVGCFGMLFVGSSALFGSGFAVCLIFEFLSFFGFVVGGKAIPAVASAGCLTATLLGELCGR